MKPPYPPPTMKPINPRPKPRKRIKCLTVDCENQAQNLEFPSKYCSSCQTKLKGQLSFPENLSGSLVITEDK